MVARASRLAREEEAEKQKQMPLVLLNGRPMTNRSGVSDSRRRRCLNGLSQMD